MADEIREERDIVGWECEAIRSHYGKLPYVRVVAHNGWGGYELTMDVHRDDVEIHTADFAEAGNFCELLPQLVAWGRELLMR